jgi:hypothetical protein
MHLPHFFRFTQKSVAAALILTGLAVVAILYVFSCALNGSGDCYQIPQFLQLIIIALLWPWVMIVRFIGEGQILLVTILGIGLSLIWVFLIVCIVRWVASKFANRR